jgi:RNA polymerase sigma factor (TIGR02999 family)
MADPQPGTVTQLLDAVDRGEAGAANKLWSILYGELRQMAHRKLAAEPHRGDRQTTSLVHDAFIRLTGGKCRFENRRHFFAAAARAMRQILVDDARRRLRLKRNEGHRPVSLQHDPLDGDRDPGDVLGIHEALERLSGVDPRKAQACRRGRWTASGNSPGRGCTGSCGRATRRCIDGACSGRRAAADV